MEVCLSQFDVVGSVLGATGRLTIPCNTLMLDTRPVPCPHPEAANVYLYGYTPLLRLQDAPWGYDVSSDCTLYWEGIEILSFTSCSVGASDHDRSLFY